VVDDDPSERVMKLKNGAKIQEQHKKIFGTGDKLKAITVYVHVNCPSEVN